MFDLLPEIFTDEDGISTACFSLEDKELNIKVPYVCTDRQKAEKLRKLLNSAPLPASHRRDVIQDYIQSLYF